MTLEGIVDSLVIRHLTQLRPHEETIPSHVVALAKEITADGMQRDPIIIDQRTGAVLDGMHRLAAFNRLGIKNSVCFAVDYSSPAVELRRWARTFQSTEGGGFGAAARDLGLVKRSRRSGRPRTDGDYAVLAIIGTDSYALPRSASLDEAFATVREIDALAAGKRWEREFVPEEDIELEKRDPSKLVLLVREIGKRDVISAAVNGRLFPCKTSMHAVDPRPVSVNFPLEHLSDSDTPGLRRELERSHPVLLPPNSTHSGRTYKERLLVLRPE